MNARKIMVIPIIVAVLLCGCRRPRTVRDEPTVLLQAECISQHPLFPTGCESVSTVMALQYLGESISTEDFIVRYLPMSNDFYYQDGRLNGPDPNRHFIGDPRKKNSYGCFAPVIEKALTGYFGSSERIVNTTGTALPDLCRQYIDHGMPVILWAGIRMESIKNGTIWFLPDGEKFIWPSGEHCVLLIGYDDTHYYVNDPYEGKTCAYDKETVEQRYSEMNRQSIVITK